VGQLGILATGVKKLTPEDSFSVSNHMVNKSLGEKDFLAVLGDIT